MLGYDSIKKLLHKDGMMLQEVDQVQQKAMDSLFHGVPNYSKQLIYVDPHKIVLAKGVATEACQSEEPLRNLDARIVDGAVVFAETSRHADIVKVIDLGLVSKIRDNELREVIEGLITAPS